MRIWVSTRYSNSTGKPTSTCWARARLGQHLPDNYAIPWSLFDSASTICTNRSNWNGTRILSEDYLFIVKIFWPKDSQGQTCGRSQPIKQHLPPASGYCQLCPSLKPILNMNPQPRYNFHHIMNTTTTSWNRTSIRCPGCQDIIESNTI